jgi:hypothetical protein
MQKAALKTNDATNTDLEVLLDLNRNYVRHIGIRLMA